MRWNHCVARVNPLTAAVTCAPCPPQRTSLPTDTKRVDAEDRNANYASTMKMTLPIEVDPEIMSGAPVFRGTRVQVLSLFEYLEDDMSLDKFLECFPTVRREDAVAVLEHRKSEFLSEART